MTDVLARIGAYWNAAATTYEQAAGHHPQTPLARHLLWTLPDPVGTLRSWRAAAPHGKLLLESLWGNAADPLERGRVRAAGLSRQLPMPDRLLGVNTTFALTAG